MVKTDKKWYTKNPQKYSCDTCNYFTSNKKDFAKHCETNKHIRGQMVKKNPQKSPDETPSHTTSQFICPYCNKSYKFQSGYSRHKSKCIKAPPDTSSDHFKMKKYNDDMLTLLKETTDTNSKLCEKIMNLEKANVINNTVNNNQKLNINVFLNTECKDAMNMSDFIKSLTLTCDDLMYTKNNGFIEGITNIFVKNLEEMAVTTRPIHCGDSKRQQFFIKNENKWEEDKKHEKIDKTIDSVAQKQIQQIKEWEEQNPDWTQSDAGTQEYIELIQTVMCGKTEQEREQNKKNIKIGLTESLLVSDDNKVIKC
jgi:hypothetical protein